jgi:hypothetical protein
MNDSREAFEIEPAFPPELPGWDYQGRGPRVTGTGGWQLSEDYAYRCVKCGDAVRGDQFPTYTCSCGAMSIKRDAGEVSSTLGDLNIMVYARDEPSWMPWNIA